MFLSIKYKPNRFLNVVIDLEFDGISRCLTLGIENSTASLEFTLGDRTLFLADVLSTRLTSKTVPNTT